MNGEHLTHKGAQGLWLFPAKILMQPQENFFWPDALRHQAPDRQVQKAQPGWYRRQGDDCLRSRAIIAVQPASFEAPQLQTLDETREKLFYFHSNQVSQLTLESITDIAFCPSILKDEIRHDR